MKLQILASLALLSFSSAAQAGFPGFVLEGEPVLPDEADTLYVFNNGVVCFTAPCPSLTVIEPDGNVVQITDLVLPESTPVSISSGITKGLEVKGEIVVAPADGFALVVSEVVDVAKPHIAKETQLVCFTAPCPNIEVMSLNGEKAMVSGFNLDHLNITDSQKAQAIEDILAGSVMVDGMVMNVTGGLGPDAEFLVTGINNAKVEALLSSTGVVCIKAPCPSWNAEIDGTDTAITGINLDFLAVSEEESSLLLEEILSGAAVIGFLAEGAVSLAGDELVFVVTQVVQESTEVSN